MPSRTSDTLTVPIGTPLEQYINGIYLNVLGRPVDTGNGQILKINTGGLAAWLTKFVQGARPAFADRQRAILLSKESRQFGVQATYTHVAGKQATSPPVAERLDQRHDPQPLVARLRRPRLLRGRRLDRLRLRGSRRQRWSTPTPWPTPP